MEILGLDIGERLIGVARASTVARLPEPLKALPNDDSFSAVLSELIAKYQAKTVVVGIPRNLDGQLTAQSRYIQDFVDQMSASIGVPVVMVDESLSSRRADEFLSQSKQQYDQDSVAACYILEEYFTTILGEQASEVQ